MNNNAAAVLLVLAALARGREVVVSRGESVEIGGGFRVPEVMEQSGARLVDVGTTNRTRLADYEAALTRPGADVALILKVHPSNYRIEGFVEGRRWRTLATLDAAVPVVADIGSGLLDAACPWLADGPPAWLEGEPAARQTLAAGAALVTFSGDKLLGGPQAGVIAGRADLVGACAAASRWPAPCGPARSCSARCRTCCWPTCAATPATPSRSGGWPVSRSTPSRLGPARSYGPRRARRRARRLATPSSRSRAPARCPAPSSRRPGSRSTATARPSCGRPTRRSSPGCRDGRTFLDLRTVDPADDATLAKALAALPPARP